MKYDAIIIGCGPAGMTAALYLLRSNKKVLILEKETIGGAIASSPLVENYPGFESISGAELSSKMFDQIDRLGVEFELEEVTKINIIDGIKEVVTEENTYTADVVIIASGSKYRMVGLENEADLIGKGIHFCVSCDGAFYNDRTVAVYGGANSAIINAISLAENCSKVYLIYHGDKLKGEKKLIEQVTNTKNIEVLYNSTITKYNGDDHLTSIEINNKDNIRLAAVFLSIGLIPQNSFAEDLEILDGKGYVLSDDTTTKFPGIFVAGDARSKKYKQVTIATADGTVAAMDAITYLDTKGE